MKTVLLKLMATGQSWGPFIVRLVVGIIFVAHGGQKFFEKGIDAVAQGFGSMGIPMPYLNAILASSAEFFGGILFILGLS